MAQRTISLEHLFFIFMQCFLPQKNRPQKYVRDVICLWPVADLDAPTPADQIFLNYMCFLVCIEWNLKRCFCLWKNHHKLRTKLCHGALGVSRLYSGGSRISSRRGRQLTGGGANIQFCQNFPKKLHEIERIRTPGGGSLAPP